MRRLRALALALALATTGCQGLRLHAKDLLYHSSPAVSVPSWIAAGLFALPPTLAWLPVSVPVLLLARSEWAIWFALGPGVVAGGPFVFLFGTPPRWIVGPTEPPEGVERRSQQSTAGGDVAPVGSR